MTENHFKPTKAQRYFLEILKNSITTQSVSSDISLSANEWNIFLHLCKEHVISPLALHALYPIWDILPDKIRESFISEKERAEKLVLIQSRSTAVFLDLYRTLIASGFQPLILKGLICRDLYPDSELRPSTDEDLLIPEESFEDFHKTLLEYGFTLANPAMNIYEAFEVTYHLRNTLCIEVHKYPFAPTSTAYGNLNNYFLDVHQTKIQKNIYGVPVFTLNDTDHLFYLICHALKHFLHSGIGIRQLCDIAVFANKNQKTIDFQKIYSQCAQIQALDFAKAIFKIGSCYLYPENDALFRKIGWDFSDVDESLLLQDILESGLYGSNSLSRLHSSTITLNAVSNHKRGVGFKGYSILRSVFLPYEDMKEKYAFLEHFPFLLPISWFLRVFEYLIELRTSEKHDNNIFDSISLGNRRVALLKYYGIVEENQNRK